MMNASMHRKFEDQEVNFKDIMFRGEPAYFTDSALGLINSDRAVKQSKDDMSMTPEISSRYDIITSIMTREIYDYGYVITDSENKMAYVDGRYLSDLCRKSILSNSYKYHGNNGIPDSSNRCHLWRFMEHHWHCNWFKPASCIW